MTLTLVFIACSIVLAYISFDYLIKRSRLNQLKKNNDKGERWATQKKPIIGGIGFFSVFIFSIVFYPVFISSKSLLDIGYWTLLVICSLGFFSGLWDDLDLNWLF